MADEVLVNILSNGNSNDATNNPFAILFGGSATDDTEENEPTDVDNNAEKRERIRAKIKNGELDHEFVEIEVEDAATSPAMDFFVGSNFEELGMSFQDMFGSIFPKRKKEESDSGPGTQNIDSKRSAKVN